MKMEYDPKFLNEFQKPYSLYRRIIMQLLFYIGLITTILAIILMGISIYDEKLVAIFGSVIFLVCGIFFMAIPIKDRDTKSIQTQWNEGKCTIDNGTMDLFQVTANKYHMFYVYKCDTCGHTETFNRSMK